MLSQPLVRSTFKRPLSICVVLGASFAPLQAQASHVVDEIVIALERASEGNALLGWFLFLDVAGSGINGAHVTGLGPQVLDLEVLADGSEASFEDGPFASLALLMAQYPTGPFSVTVNGTDDVPLVWNPAVPETSDQQEAFVTNLDPGHGTAIDATMPDYSYTTNCTNCDGFLELCTFNASGTVSACFESDAAPFPTTVMFSELTHGGTAGMISELPAGQYDFESFVTARMESALDPPFAQGVYIQDTGAFDQTTYTVPEPGALAAQLAGLAGIFAGWRRSALRRS